MSTFRYMAVKMQNGVYLRQQNAFNPTFLLHFKVIDIFLNYYYKIHYANN